MRQSVISGIDFMQESSAKSLLLEEIQKSCYVSCFTLRISMISFRNFFYLLFLSVFILVLPGRAYAASPSNEKTMKQFNRILDDQAREEYANAIQTLFKTSPEMMKRKIPRANVQQGFVLDTVRNFAKANSKILSVGCFEDTAYEALLKLGYKVEGIDPGINHDLNAFYHLPTLFSQHL
jgi:hypothetical protein